MYRLPWVMGSEDTGSSLPNLLASVQALMMCSRFLHVRALLDEVVHKSQKLLDDSSKMAGGTALATAGRRSKLDSTRGVDMGAVFGRILVR